jgi:adenylate cyclase
VRLVTSKASLESQPMGKLPKLKKAPILTALIVAIGMIALRGTGILQLLEWAALDQFWRWRPADPIDRRIVVVAIDEAFIQSSEEWPISDARLAQLLKNIRQQKPVAIGLDIYRDLSVGEGKEELLQVFATTPNLVGITKAIGDRVPPPLKLAELGHFGFNDVLLDRDGKVRRALLSVQNFGGETSYSFPLMLALTYLERLGISPVTAGETIIIGKSKFQSLHPNFGGYVNLNAAGYQILLNYPQPDCRGSKSCEIFPTVSISEVLNGQIAPNFFRDRLVLIGSTAESVKDRFFTPFSGSDLNAAPGVEIHADIISQILSSAIDGRAVFQDFDESLEWLWILVWSGLGAIIAMPMSKGKRIAIAYLILSNIALIGSSFLAFLIGWWIPLVPALMALFLSLVTTTGITLTQNLQQYYKELAAYLHTLEQQVSDRTQALSQKNAELEMEILEKNNAQQALQATFSNLQLTQTQLIESEKMAALGSLVAGVAHEINTPIGNSILAASTLANEIKHFEQLIESGTIKRSLLQEYLSVYQESSEIILSNLRRAGELVQSFKQVAVDRSSEELRRFTVKPYIEDVLLSLEPKLKLTPHHIQIFGDPKVTMIGHPGAFSQVITNLLLNSLFHAYPNNNQIGNLIFEIESDSQNLTLRYSDDGCGIPSEHLDQIFNPFFTTARDRGGSGLGLHIVYNLVTQSLRGTVQVQSEVGEGTRFILILPLCIDPDFAPEMELEPISHQNER